MAIIKAFSLVRSLVEDESIHKDGTSNIGITDSATNRLLWHSVTRSMMVVIGLADNQLNLIAVRVGA